MSKYINEAIQLLNVTKAGLNPANVKLVDEIIEGLKKELQFKPHIRNLVADYMRTEGCSCCRDIEGHKKNTARLGKALDVPKYSDGSGYEFSGFASPKYKRKENKK